MSEYKKRNLGKMPCETCGETVTVKEKYDIEHPDMLGTLSYRCDECDAAPYSKAGTFQNQRWRAKIIKPSNGDPSNGDPQKTKTPPVNNKKTDWLSEL
jgi:hypothetical protein